MNITSRVNATVVMERLGIGKDQFRAIGLLPLAYVAWADGSLQIFERSRITEFAKAKGWLGSGEGELLAHWLADAPKPEDALDAARAIAALARDTRSLGSSVPAQTPADILIACHEVAGASGGLFGLRSAISAEESAALQQVADALEIEPGADWRSLVPSLSSEAGAEHAAPGSSAQFSLVDIPEMQRDPLGLFLRKWQEHGDLTRLRLGPYLGHLASHPDHVQHVLVENHRNYVRDPLFEEFSRVLGDGVLTLDGEPWLRQRRMMQPAFHQKKVAGMADVMVREGRNVIDSLLASATSGRTIDLAEEMSRMGLRTAGKTLFNTETAEEADALMPAMKALFGHVALRNRSIVKIPEAIPTAENRRYRDALELLERKVYETIAQRRRTKQQHEDLLSLLLEARDEETGEGMTDQQLRNEVLALMLGGSDTSTVVLTWTWALISKNPLVLRELRAELDRVLGGRDPSLDDLPKLVYTWAILQEAMRMMPPAWCVVRKAVGEDILSGVRIPSGSLVYLSPYLVHRHPEFWDNPEAFDPSRFTPENDARRHPSAYIPFGAGPRKCLGAAFATMQMKIVIAMMAQEVELHLVPGFEPQRDASLFLRTKNGCWMTARPRKRGS
jgi:cytochrome P450